MRQLPANFRRLLSVRLRKFIPHLDESGGDNLSDPFEAGQQHRDKDAAQTTAVKCLPVARGEQLQILVAPAAFKGTLSPFTVAQAIAGGITDAAGDKQVSAVCVPLADGGDGTIETVHAVAGGTLVEQQVLDALGRPVNAFWLKLKDSALIELASICGLALLSAAPLAPLSAHTYGLGQMIARCFEAGMTAIDIALGGSASTDGGMGALRALGAAFFDDSGHELTRLGGGCLHLIRSVDLSDTRLLVKSAKLRLLTDVTSPLLGKHGAAAVFAPQKGASLEQVKELEIGLTNFADVLERQCNNRLRDLPGSGAAGGTAFGLAAALGCRIESGFAYVAEIAGLSEKIAASDLVITAEGKLDGQSMLGKVPGHLARLCRQQGKPLWVVAAAKSDDAATDAVASVIIARPKSGATVCTADDIRAAIASNIAAAL